MKKIFYFFFFLTAIQARAGNWDLFPYQHRNVYVSTQQDSLHYVYAYNADSLRVPGPDSFYIFNQKRYAVDYPYCYSHINYQNVEVPVYSDPFQMDSVSTNGIYYTISINLASLSFYNHASLNYSWTVLAAPYASMLDSVRITCSSLGIENIFGTDDSVKIFSLVAYNNGSIIPQFANYHYKLSKSFGFIEFIPFRNLLEDDYWYSFEDIVLLTLRRMEIGGQAYGFSFPQFSDYFHYHNGDILKWHSTFTSNYVWNPTMHDYFRDSIYSVATTADSVCYTIDMHGQHFTEGQNDTFYYFNTSSSCIYKKQFDPFLQNGKGETVINNNNEGGVNGLNGVMVWNYDFQAFGIPDTMGNFVQIDSADGSACFIVHGFDFGNWLDTLNCNLNFSADDEELFIINTIVGFKCHETFMAGGNEQACVIGYILGNDTSGNWFPLGVLSSSQQTNFQIRPTLARDFIQVVAPDSRQGQATIFTAQGKLVSEKIFSSEENIDVGGLPAGIYFVKLQSQKKEGVLKFIKQ